MVRASTLATALAVLAMLTPVSSGWIPSLDETAPAPLQPALAARLRSAGPHEPLQVIVSFADDDGLASFLPLLGDRAGSRLTLAKALRFTTTPAELALLAAMPDVAYVELDEPEPLLLPTATLASRARAVWGGFLGGPVRHPASGQVVDGRGVGVAIVDTGLNAAHPDFAGRVAKNFKVVSALVTAPPVMLNVTDSGTSSGHGTHVAGIAAGSGVASGGLAAGAAPGATLYAFGVGDGINILFDEEAFEWILANHDKVNPPIRVVSNSWGSDGNFDPNATSSRLATMLVKAGVTVVFAAGNGDELNNGGNGSDDRVNRHAKNPIPGVIGVANYDDDDTGTRDGMLAPSSSRGLRTDPRTWPDLAAPGTSILAALDQTSDDGAIDAGFGAYPQHAGSLAFRLGGVTSRSVEVDWIIYLNPAAVYNAHRNAFATGPESLDLPSASELAAARFFGAVGAGPVRPRTDSRQSVGPGDALVLTKDPDIAGVEQQVPFRIVSPSGTEKVLTGFFPCARGCRIELPLTPAFAGEPADGTWTVLPANASPRPYTSLTGTSMAAPHVAGIVALVLQANPSLTPAEVEDLLEDTAYKFGFGAPYQEDPVNADNPSSFDKGHGLVDALAAVSRALGR